MPNNWSLDQQSRAIDLSTDIRLMSVQASESQSYDSKYDKDSTVGNIYSYNTVCS